MAIVIRGKTMCSLCDAILSDTDDIVMFPHFISVQTHPLWRFSDSAMHRSCFAGWPQASYSAQPSTRCGVNRCRGTRAK